MRIKSTLIALAFVVTAQAHADELSDLRRQLSGGNPDKFSAVQSEMEVKQAASTAQEIDVTCNLYACLAQPVLLHSDSDCKAGLDGMIDRAIYNVKHFWKPKPLIEPYPMCLDVSTPNADPDAQRIERGRFHLVQIADDDPAKDQMFFLEPDWCDELPRFDTVTKAGDCLVNVNTYSLYLYDDQLGDTLLMNDDIESNAQWTIDPETLIITPVVRVDQ